MGELDAIKNFIGKLVKESVDSAMADAVQKYLTKKTERFYSVDEACKLLKIGRTALYDRLKSGFIKSKMQGNTRQIFADELDAMIESGKAGRYVHFRPRK